MEKYKQKLKALIRLGLFHILGANVINYFILFITNIIIIRLLNKTNYGIYSYAYNLYSIVLLFSGLGLLNGLLQYGSEARPEPEKVAYNRFGLVFGMLFNLLLSAFIFLYGHYAIVSISQSSSYITQFAFLPLFDYLYNFCLIVLRTNKKNKEYARLLNTNTIYNFLGTCVGAYFWGISGLILGKYFSFILSILTGFYLCNKPVRKISTEGEGLRPTQKWQIVHYSVICCLSACVISLLYYIDILVVGHFIPNASIVASYKTATLIPTALTFIPNSIMVLMYPYFAEQNQNYPWIKRHLHELTRWLFCFNAIIAILLIVGAPFIIEILWGKEYLDIIATFRILMISYFVTATFRIPYINILAALRKVKLNLIVGIISAVFNFVLDIWFVQIWGINGVSAATVLVFIIASGICCPYLEYYLHKKMQTATADIVAPERHEP